MCQVEPLTPSELRSCELPSRSGSARRRAVCAKDVADHNLCLALNRQQAAESTLTGSAFGLLLGFVGSSALALPCRGHSEAAPWAPARLLPWIVPASRVPRSCCSYGAKSWPSNTSRRIRTAVGTLACRFGPSRRPAGSTAQSASMAKGDALWQIEGQSVPIPEPRNDPSSRHAIHDKRRRRW